MLNLAKLLSSFDSKIKKMILTKSVVKWWLGMLCYIGDKVN